MNRVTLINADVLAGLAMLPDESVQCCVTSPPYWGLRDYGIEPQVWGGDLRCSHVWDDKSYRESRKRIVGEMGMLVEITLTSSPQTPRRKAPHASS